MAAKQILPVQFSVPVEARKDLRRLAIDISDDLVPSGELRYTEMCAYAALHLLSCGHDHEEVKRIIRAGMAHEEVYAAKPGQSEMPSEPEKPAESAPIKPPVNAANIWAPRVPEAPEGKVNGLDRDRPPARKVRKSPRRK